MQLEPIHVVLAIGVGAIPIVIWLWFWLKEDRRKPEPWWLLFVAFVAGMAVVTVALPSQQLACDYYQNGICRPVSHNLMLLWVIIEEAFKYLAALIVVFWNRFVDEPIDLIIYMIMVALGFAAFENALFVFNLASSGYILDSIFTGVFRFIGPTLLHILASATIGVFLAFAFYRSALMKTIFGMVGLFIAIALHALFNFFIMNVQDNAQGGTIVLTVFLTVWIGIIGLLLIFEKVKLLERNHRPRRRL